MHKVYFAMALRISKIKRTGFVALKKNILGLTFLTLRIFLGPVANAMNHYSLKPFGQRVGQLVGGRPLIHSGRIKEDLLYFIDRPVQ
jgi:hypothetical protein